MNIYHVWRIDYSEETNLYHEFVCIAASSQMAREMIPSRTFSPECWDHPIPEDIWPSDNSMINVLKIGVSTETEPRVIMAG